MEDGATILIFDVGKTNKKILLFDSAYRIIHQEATSLAEIVDEDGFPCENIDALTEWLRESYQSAKQKSGVAAVNFSGYGASFVHVDASLRAVAPLYNYLKPFPPSLLDTFYNAHRGREEFSRTTASPVLGSLNSGMQLFRIKREQPATYNRIRWALHLPQYLSAVISGAPYAEITSIGCHTNLWDFRRKGYHEWVYQEGLDLKFPKIIQSNSCVTTNDGICCGIGLHDSSAALIPYLASITEPFILLSTGTWCISLNPFNHQPLTGDELQNDCLCYLTYKGEPVKASRLFAGHEHDVQVKRIAAHFQTAADSIEQSDYSLEEQRLRETAARIMNAPPSLHFKFGSLSLDDFANVSEAYYALVTDLVRCQYASTMVVLKGSNVNQLFVDGGFSRNPLFMRLLTLVFPTLKVFAADVAQASALGAALAIDRHWNTQKVPKTLVSLTAYSRKANHVV